MMMTPEAPITVTVFGRILELSPHSDCSYREYRYQQPGGLYTWARYIPEWADSDDAWTVSMHYKGCDNYQGSGFTLESAEAEVLKRIRNEARYLEEFLGTLPPAAME